MLNKNAWNKARGITMVALLLSSLSLSAVTFKAVQATSYYGDSSLPGKLEVTSMLSGNEIKTINDKIVIRNVGQGTVYNIRVLLSPELHRSFQLNDTAIKSIAPNNNVTITFEINGNRNRDAAGNLGGYAGNVLVLAENHNPILLPVTIGAEQSNESKGYIEIITNVAQQRYGRISTIDSTFPNFDSTFKEHVGWLSIIAEQRYQKRMLLNPTPTDQESVAYGYEVSSSNANNTKTIRGPNDELIITNLSDKPLENVRIFLSLVGNAFLLEKKFIPYIEPYGQANVKLLPRFDMNKYSPRDIIGQVMISSYDKAVQLPINVTTIRDESNALEVSTIYGNNSLKFSADNIVIKNITNKTMNSVELRLTGNLEKTFMLSENSFRQIKPGEELTVGFKQMTWDVFTFMQDHAGELTLMSERHVIARIPVNVEWKVTSSEHFDVFAREGYESVAQQVVDLLETNYEKAESMLGSVKTRSTIYIAQNMDELKPIGYSESPYFYHYKEDVIFLCSCNQPVENALRGFLYKLIMNNHASYHNMMKIALDKENWLVDGLVNYFASEIIGKPRIVQQYLDEFSNNTATDFQYYGHGSNAQYGAAYSFLDYLQSKYGSTTIYMALKYLGSGMVSNHECFTLETCMVVQAVKGLVALQSDKRQTLDIDAIISGWKDYVAENYGK